MDSTQNTVDLQQPIRNFTTLPANSLESLIRDLGLGMSVRDLTYCQNQYRLRERRAPTGDELRFLDALYLHRSRQIDHCGLRRFYTSDPMVAETYADMMAKASRFHRDARPYTPPQLAQCLTQTLARIGKHPSVSSLYNGSGAPFDIFADGYEESYYAKVGNIPAVIGLKKKQPTFPEKGDPHDHIVLLSAPKLSPPTFATILKSLELPVEAQRIPVDHRGLLEALLAWDSVYLVQNTLPGMKDAPCLSELVTGFSGSILVRLSRELAIVIRDKAQAIGLDTAIIAKCIPGQKLTIRREGLPPVQLETAFLRTFVPMIPIDVEIPGNCLTAYVNTTESVPQTVSRACDCALVSPSLPQTPYVMNGNQLLTGSVSYPCDNPFAAALFTTMHAVNRAVAAGVEYDQLTLSRRVVTPHTELSITCSETVAALLGSYRVQAELSIPDVNIRFASDQSNPDHTEIAVVAAAPMPNTPIPHTFTSAGNNVYLLMPLSTPTSPVDFEDYRKLLRYVHHLCAQGIARSVYALDATGIMSGLRAMAQQGYGFLAREPLPVASIGFLIETDQIIQGALIGLTTATPTIRIGEVETTVTNYRQTAMEKAEVPMSRIGCAHPVLCLPQTDGIGNISPILHWAEEKGAVVHTVPALNLSSREQLTALANAMSQANITVIVGTTEEIDTLFANRRVAYAKEKILTEDKLLLCLHTDLTHGKNQPVPKDHPFFYGVMPTHYDRVSLSFEGENLQVVHMSASCTAILPMLSCAIAYFQ